MPHIPSDPLAILTEQGHLTIPLDASGTRAVTHAFEAAAVFFRASEEEKLRCRLPHDCGYRPSGIEYSQSAARPDPIASFSACARLDPRDTELSVSCAQVLYDSMWRVLTALEPIAELVAIRIARTLGAATANLGGSMHRWSILQMNYARPSDTDTEFIHEEHEDGHLLTLGCSDGPGLELKTPGGNYSSGPGVPSVVVVMPGEILQLLSGGRVQPLLHRVRRHAAVRERLALLFFADIDPLRCAPWVLSDTNRGVDIGERVLTNAGRFGLAGFARE